MLKGNDATLFASFKPFIFVVFFFFFFNFLLEPLQTKLRNDIIQMCLSILRGGVEFGVVACTVIGVMDDKMNHCYYYGTVKTNTSMHLNSSAGKTRSSVSVSDLLTDVVEKPQVVNVSRRCAVNESPPPPPPLTPRPCPHPYSLHAQNNISSDVQYKPQTLPSKHPTMTSHRKRGDYKE